MVLLFRVFEVAMKANAIELGMYAVETLPVGEFVRKSEDAKKTYRRESYDRSTKRYVLTDCDDINREISVKPGTMLHAGFTY